MDVRVRKTFQLGARVVVSSEGGWERNAVGTIVDGPEPIETLQGPEFYWWVQFATPERDIDGDGPYFKAQILSRYIKDAT
jgi:hypothetical protein